MLLLNRNFEVTTARLQGVDVPFRTTADAAELAGRMGVAEAAAAVKYAKIAIISLPARSAGEPVLEVRYCGQLYDPPANGRFSREYADLQTAGIVGEEGVFLTPEGYWYPRLGDESAALTVTLDGPADFFGVTAGVKQADETRDGRRVVTWREDRPTEPAYVMGGRYLVRQTQWEGIDIYTCFFPEEDALSAGYLEAVKRYLGMYTSLIGPYPFKKFAVVENFLPTGYGMPSFTVLGRDVIRLPFIVDISLGHEVLHNWFGNCILVDPAGGNWCEGLTTYLADHYYKELKSPAEAAAYRKELLAGYMAYIKPGTDLALKDFTERRDPATRAVGYGKAAMVFHMLRVQLGETVFFDAVKRFYQEQAWKRASWKDIQRIFETVYREQYLAAIRDKEARGIRVPRDDKTRDLSLGWFFRQWVETAGAPTLRVQLESLFRPAEGQYVTDFILSQPDPVFQMMIPVHLDCGDKTEIRVVKLDGPRKEIQILLPDQPRTLRIDPDADIFRKLLPDEVPPSLAEVFGAERLEVVLPADPEKTEAVKEFARKTWAGTDAVSFPADGRPSGGAAWLAVLTPGQLSDPLWKSLAEAVLPPQAGGVTIDGQLTPLAGRTIVVAMRNVPLPMPPVAGGDAGPEAPHIAPAPVPVAPPAAPPGPPGAVPPNAVAPPAPPGPAISSLLLVTDVPPAALARVLTKCAHYGKYGYLVFEGETNVIKGQWKVTRSPLIVPIADLPAKTKR